MQRVVEAKSGLVVVQGGGRHAVQDARLDTLPGQARRPLRQGNDQPPTALSRPGETFDQIGMLLGGDREGATVSRQKSETEKQPSTEHRHQVLPGLRTQRLNSVRATRRWVESVSCYRNEEILRRHAGISSSTAFGAERLPARALDIDIPHLLQVDNALLFLGHHVEEHTPGTDLVAIGHRDREFRQTDLQAVGLRAVRKRPLKTEDRGVFGGDEPLARAVELLVQLLADPRSDDANLDVRPRVQPREP